MLLTTHFILLLFALGSSGHSLSRIQITNKSDIYDVKEKPNNTFEIIEPKLKVPTLREIIYLKIKETPSKGCLEKEKLPQEQGPDFDDSERPNTNGQGLQFLEFIPIEEPKSSEDDNSNNHSNESKNDSSDSDSVGTESVPDSDESSNDSDDSNDSDSDESNDSDSDDSSDSDDDDSSDSDSDSSSHENSPDSSENNKNSDDSKESNSDNHESKPDSLESNKDNDHSSVNESDNHESRPDESNNDSGSNGSRNNSKEANKGNRSSNESKNDSKESKGGNSKERNNGNIGSNDSKNDSKESNNGNSGSNESKKDSKEGNNGNIGSNDSKTASKENYNGNIDSNESKESQNGNNGSNGSKNDSKESNNGSNGSKNDSKESKGGNNSSNGSKNDSKESNNGNIGSNDSKESNNGNSGSKKSKKDSKEGNNGNIGSNDSKTDSKENYNGNIDSNGSKIDSKEGNNGDSGSNGSKNDSKESSNGYIGSNESKNDNKESYNSNNGSNESKNNSKKTNKDNSGSNESKIDSHENQNNSNKGQTDNHNESKADNDNLKGFSSDADNGDDKDNEDKDSRDTSTGLDERSGGSRNVNEISDNITPDKSQSTEPTAAVSKNEADSTKLLRRKRDIDFGMLPPPPVLQPLNTRMLPDFIQRMLSNIPALNDVTSPDERGESNYENENRPQNYGFHLKNDNGRVWNNFPFINQENYINQPSNTINKKKQEEYLEDVPDSDASSSYDNSLYSDNDSGYNAETDEGTDKSGDDNSIDGVWPNIGAPVIDFNNFMPHNPITKEKEFGNFGNEINKNSDIVEQREPTIQLTTETNIENRYKKSTEKEPIKAPIYTPPQKTKININKDLKEKIEMSFDNIGKIAPPILTRFEENLVKTAVKNNETPLTFGMKLTGANGYAWNDLADPGEYYLFGETIDTDKEWNEPSSPATQKFHEYNTEPTNADENATEANERTNSPIRKDKVTTQRVPETFTESQSQKPTTEFEKLNEPNKESLDKDKDKLDDKKDNEAVQVALDDLLKKDAFWQWLTKWTAAYIGVLNERVEKLVKREVAKQVNKTMNAKVEKEKEKDKIDTNNNDLTNKNETIANVTTVEPPNNTNEINTNNTTTEKSIPEANNTNKIDTNNTTTEKSISEANNTNKSDTNSTTTEKSIPEANNTNENIVSEKDQINAMNKTTSDGHKSNKTTPTNTHTIYGNAIDSDHVTNIFIFYPNAESNATAKDIEAILGNKNNVVVLGKPPNDNKISKAPDCTTNSPFDDTTGIYAIDQKKDIVSKASEQTSQAPERATSPDPAAADPPVTVKIEDSTAATKPDASSATEPTSGNSEPITNVSSDTVSSNTTEPTSSNSEPITNVSSDTVSSNTTESTSSVNPEATNDDAATPSTTTVPDTITTAPVQ